MEAMEQGKPKNNHCRNSTDHFYGTINRLEWVISLNPRFIRYVQKKFDFESYHIYDNDGKKWLIDLEIGYDDICVTFELLSPTTTTVVAGLSLSTFSLNGRLYNSFQTKKPHNFTEEKRFENAFSFEMNHNIVTLHCTIEQMDSSKVMAINKTAVTDDYGRLFESGTHSDVILSVDGHELKAHKAILSARSEVFSAMFEHQMLENKSNLVTITDLKLGVVKEMLHFIYTGNSPKIAEMTFELLNAAEKYALMDLRNMCAIQLIQETTKETAAEMEVIADRYNIEALKKYAKKFMSPDGNDKTNTEPENDAEIQAKKKRYSSDLSDDDSCYFYRDSPVRFSDESDEYGDGSIGRDSDESDGI